MTEQTQHFINTIFGERGYDKSIRRLDKYGNKIAETQTKAVKIGGKLYTVTRKLGKENKLLGTTIAQTTNKQNDFTLAMRRALIVAPIWMAARTAMMKVLEAMKDIVNVYKELDEGMKRVMAVATFTANTQARIYGELQQAAKAYFATSTAGMKDITESMYQLGTAGLSTEQIMEGFEHVMNLSIGTYGDVTSAGRLMAGVFNVFGDELKNVGDTAEQMKYVADLMATAWRNNQVELTEINTAMGYLASSGKIVGLGLKELVASAALMSDALLRGGKGGRLLARAFVQISKSGKKLADLGVWFDPTKPLDFYDVMKQLHEVYIRQGRSLDFLNQLVDVFGVRGIRAVGAHLEIWEKFNEEVKRTPEAFKGASEEIAKIAQLSRIDLTKKIWHKVITGVGAPEKTAIRKEIEKMVAKDDTRIKQMVTINKLIEKHGSALNISKEVLKDINKESKDMAKIPFVQWYKDALLWANGLGGVAIVNKLIRLSTKEISDYYKEIVERAKELGDVTEEVDWDAFTEAALKKTKTEDIALKKTKDDLEYKLMALRGVSKTAITMEKINKLLETRNKAARYLGRTEATIGDVLTLNKEALEGTVHLEKLIKLGVEATLNAETDKQKILQMSVNHQLDLLKIQGASLEHILRTKILLEESQGFEKNVVDLAKNRLDLEKAITSERDKQTKLSSTTMKLYEVFKKYGVEATKEVAKLLKGMTEFKKFEEEAIGEAWMALKEFFPERIKAERAKAFFREEAPFEGLRGKEIPIREEWLRGEEEQRKLMLKSLESQLTIKETELQKQIEVLEKQKEIKEELTKQTQVLREIDRKRVSPEVKVYFANKPVSKDDFVVEIKTEGTPIANALDDRIEKF